MRTRNLLIGMGLLCVLQVVLLLVIREVTVTNVVGAAISGICFLLAVCGVGLRVLPRRPTFVEPPKTPEAPRAPEAPEAPRAPGVRIRVGNISAVATGGASVKAEMNIRQTWDQGVGPDHPSHRYQDRVPEVPDVPDVVRNSHPGISVQSNGGRASSRSVVVLNGDRYAQETLNGVHMKLHMEGKTITLLQQDGVDVDPESERGKYIRGRLA